MPAFEYPEFTLIAYGKTGSTSLTVEAEHSDSYYPHIVKTENGHVWEPVLGINWQSLPDKPTYLVMRPPEDRLLSGIQMFLMVRYCDNLIVQQDLSRKWADMMPEPNPYKSHFLRTLKELWSTEEFWTTHIPEIFSFFRSDLFAEESDVQEYLRSEPGGITPEQADNRLKTLLNRYGVTGDFYTCWQDLFTNRLTEERYHMGNYLVNCEPELLSGWIPLKDLSAWSEHQTGMNTRIPQQNSNQSRGFHIAPGTLWSKTDHADIIRAMRQGIKNCSIWWLWQRYLTAENVAYQDIQNSVPKLGLEPAAIPYDYVPYDRNSND